MKSYSPIKLVLVCMLSFMGVTLMAQTVSRSKPWSVRMAESEMIRTPKGWQLDFSTAPKWNYCHGLVLQSMMDVYDRYGDKKFYD